MADTTVVPRPAGPAFADSRLPALPTNGVGLAPEESDFATVYGAHAATAGRVANGILRDEHLAADVVQEAFVSLWLLGERFTPERGSHRGLVRTLVHHRAVDILRKRELGPGTVALDDATTTLLVDRNLGPESAALASDQAGRLWTVVNALTAAKREALVLAYRHGLSHTEIADLLRIPLGTVKSRIQAARLDLFRLLAAEIGDDD